MSNRGSWTPSETASVASHNTQPHRRQKRDLMKPLADAMSDGHARMKVEGCATTATGQKKKSKVNGSRWQHHHAACGDAASIDDEDDESSTVTVRTTVAVFDRRQSNQPRIGASKERQQSQGEGERKPQPPTDVKNFGCNECSFTTNTRAELARHLFLTVHCILIAVNTVFVPQGLTSMFDSVRNQLAPRNFVEIPKTVKSLLEVPDTMRDKKAFLSSRSLQMLLKPLVRYRCPACCLLFSTADALKSHCRTAGHAQLKCLDCSEVFNIDSQIKMEQAFDQHTVNSLATDTRPHCGVDGPIWTTENCRIESYGDPALRAESAAFFRHYAPSTAELLGGYAFSDKRPPHKMFFCAECETASPSRTSCFHSKIALGFHLFTCHPYCFDKHRSNTSQDITTCIDCSPQQKMTIAEGFLHAAETSLKGRAHRFSAIGGINNHGPLSSAQGLLAKTADIDRKTQELWTSPSSLKEEQRFVEMFQCPECFMLFDFADEEALEQAVKAPADDTPFFCSEDRAWREWRMDTRGSLERHLKNTQHGFPQCLECGEVLSNSRAECERHLEGNCGAVGQGLSHLPIELQECRVLYDRTNVSHLDLAREDPERLPLHLWGSFEGQSHAIDGSVSVLQRNPPMSDSVAQDRFRNEHVAEKLRSTSLRSEGRRLMIHRCPFPSCSTADGRGCGVFLSAAELSDHINANPTHGTFDCRHPDCQKQRASEHDRRRPQQASKTTLSILRPDEFTHHPHVPDIAAFLPAEEGHDPASPRGRSGCLNLMHSIDDCLCAFTEAELLAAFPRVFLQCPDCGFIIIAERCSNIGGSLHQDSGDCSRLRRLSSASRWSGQHKEDSSNTLALSSSVKADLALHRSRTFLTAACRVKRLIESSTVW